MKAKSKLYLVDKIILWLNGLLCLALLISYLAPIVDPKKMWELAFFGLAYPTLLMANLIVIVYWVIRRKWFALASILCILCGWNVLTNNFGFRKSSANNNAGPNFIRIMTYNVHHFRKYGSKIDVSTRGEILQIIKEEQPDIIGFQEYFSRKTGQYDFTDSIKRILNVNYFLFKNFTTNPRKTVGMAVFSRYPIVNSGIILLSDTSNENQCLFIDVKKGDRQFRYYDVHLKSIGFDPEDYKYLDSVSAKGKTDMHSTKRVSEKLRNAFLKRSAQMYIVKNHSLHCPYPYIIGGDFNDTPSSFAVNQMAKGLKNAFREKGSGFGRTYNGDFPNFQIDYVMTSPQFDIENYLIIPKKLSDHYPVRSDVLLVH